MRNQKDSFRTEPPSLHRQRNLLILAGLPFGLWASLELGFRFVGFGKGALYRADADYEYIHAPNQITRPYGNLVVTNSLGMRSEALRPSDEVLAVVVGDSVVNGGNHTDHYALATTMLDRHAREKYGEHWRVLTVSAGSWGPDNIAAFLRKHGTFGARQILVVLSSHDIGDIMDYRPVVDVLPAYPSTRPLCVSCEVISRYVVPTLASKLRNTVSESDPIDKFDGRINPGWADISTLASASGALVTVLIHRELSELTAGRIPPHDQVLRGHLAKLGITPATERHVAETGYLDTIHLNSLGQRQLFEDLVPLLVAPTQR